MIFNLVFINCERVYDMAGKIFIIILLLFNLYILRNREGNRIIIVNFFLILLYFCVVLLHCLLSFCCFYYVCVSCIVSPLGVVKTTGHRTSSPTDERNLEISGKAACRVGYRGLISCCCCCRYYYNFF